MRAPVNGQSGKEATSFARMGFWRM
jgi:hypothetical protein